MAPAAARPRNIHCQPVGRAVCVGVGAGEDAGLFAALAIERGFVGPVLLLGQQASRATVRATLVEMAALSEPGDLFLLTFAGHGGRTRVRVRDDESREVGTWQLYDGTLNDVQIKADLARFRPGVRVLVVSDNCCGGIPALGPSDMKASVLVFAACEEGQYADGAGLPGHFSALLRRTLNEDVQSYPSFYEALCKGMPSYQRPGYYRLGVSDATFESQRPFTI